MLSVADLHVSLSHRAILRGITLDFQPGKFYAIIGPNGAGKSTLLRAMTGELKPASGAVLLDGASLGSCSASALARRRAVVPQAAPLSFPFLVHEVVSLGVTVPGFGLSPHPEPVKTAIAMVGIEHLRNRLYTQLSGGERQQVQIARALCQLLASPAAIAETMLFLDEPTSNLDLPHQLHLMQTAQDQARAGRLVVAVLHDINLATAWADIVVAVGDGRIRASGAPRAMLTGSMLEQLYGRKICVQMVPGSDVPLVLPRMA